MILWERADDRREPKHESNNHSDELIFLLWISNWLHFEFEWKKNNRVLYAVCVAHAYSAERFTQMKCVSMGSNVAVASARARPPLWIWWMTIRCKITTISCYMWLQSGDTLKPKSGERCLFYSRHCKRRTFMLMNLIDHYGFGWQKAPKTIRVLLPTAWISAAMGCNSKTYTTSPSSRFRYAIRWCFDSRLVCRHKIRRLGLVIEFK